MLTSVQDDLFSRADPGHLTFAEAWERETRRERLVRLIADIAETRDEPDEVVQPLQPNG